jgi:hypothetical protein
VPVGQLLGQQPRRPFKWRAITQWRDWSISAKLAAVTLVPIVFALVLGGITISNQVGNSNNYERMDRLVTLGGDVRTLLDALQQERTETATLLTQGTVGNSSAVDTARASVDKAIPQFRTDVARAAQLDVGVSERNITIGNALNTLTNTRQQVTAGRLDVIQALDNYSSMTNALLALDTVLVADIGDSSIGGTPSALHDLQEAKEEISNSEALVSYGISRGSLPPAQINNLRTAEVRLADRLDDFRAAATMQQQQDYDRTVQGADNDTRNRLVGNLLTAAGTS